MTRPERLWFTGEGRAVDSIVYRDGHIVLVLRKDGGGWAIPGGFVDPGESDEHAMRRELREETGLDVAYPPWFMGVRRRVDDPRNEADRWITTQVGVFFLSVVAFPTPPVLYPADDAVRAGWYPLYPARQIDMHLRAISRFGLYPPHVPLIDEFHQFVNDNGRQVTPR